MKRLNQIRMEYSDFPLILDPFFYVDYNGSNDFPKQDAIRADAAKGIATVLILDANICVRLCNYAQGEKDRTRKEVTRLFLLQAERAKVEVVPLLGCVELAATRQNNQLDQVKLLSRVSAAYSALLQSEYDLLHERPVSIEDVPDVSFTASSLLVFYPALRYFYCCFLKITSLRIGSRKNLKNKVLKNVVEFQNWCESMECHVGLILQAAIEVLGGAPDSNALLNVKAGKTPLDAAWRAAWDMWYCWMTQHFFRTVTIDEQAQHPIFVTEDRSAAYIAGKCLPQALFTNQGAPFLSASSVSVNAPYLAGKEEQLLEALDKPHVATAKRAARRFADSSERVALDHDRVEEEIAQLEKAIMAIS